MQWQSRATNGASCSDGRQEVFPPAVAVQLWRHSTRTQQGVLLVQQIVSKHCNELPPTLLLQTSRGHLTVFCLTFYYTHTQPFNGLWSGTTRVGWYQKKHSPTHTHPDHQTSFIIFLHLQRSVAPSLFILCARQSSRTTSLQVLFGLHLGLGPSTSYSIHFFAQSSSAFHILLVLEISKPFSIDCCQHFLVDSAQTSVDWARICFVNVEYCFGIY